MVPRQLSGESHARVVDRDYFSVFDDDGLMGFGGRTGPINQRHVVNDQGGGFCLRETRTSQPNKQRGEQQAFHR
jgi:hypothetical protein